MRACSGATPGPPKRTSQCGALPTTMVCLPSPGTIASALSDGPARWNPAPIRGARVSYTHAGAGLLFDCSFGVGRARAVARTRVLRTRSDGAHRARGARGLALLVRDGRGLADTRAS